MSEDIGIVFTKTPSIEGGTALLLAAGGGALSPGAVKAADPDGVAGRAMDIAKFDGRKFATLDLIAPHASPADRLAIVGIGDPDDLKPGDWPRIGGASLAAARGGGPVTVFLEAAGAAIGAREAADFALGMLLRGYRFDRYRTVKKPDDGQKDERDGSDGAGARNVSVIIVTGRAAAARKAFADARTVVDGVALARDLVNEPANALGPAEFAARAGALEKLGVDVNVLTEKEMRKLGMGALLGVARGSSRPPRLVVMQWKGGKTKRPPVAFVGKGVVFDAGGISLKPGAGMEEMKGDMGGAAAVLGLMHTLASRKAKVNAVGIVGLAENMPDGDAQRPGDIVTSLSGQTVEVVNTDAEGRLVLCDALWYCEDRFRPRCMIDLATLTGAVIVALGHHRAGLFSSDDELSARLTEAGEATGERVWRLPLGAEYDRMIDSKFADMKNVGGRWAGSITAAQFLKRFVRDTPWAHLDIAGTAFAAPHSEISRSWGSGFGVRLLDALVRAHYES